MVGLDSLAQALAGSDDRYADTCLKELFRQSENSDTVFACFCRFAAMMNAQNSCQRTRSQLLNAANAQWDTKGKVEEILPQYLRHITTLPMKKQLYRASALGYCHRLWQAGWRLWRWVWCDTPCRFWAH